MASFLTGCSSVSPSLAGIGVDVVLSSARMVSSFDSTPARKEPHLDVTFEVMGGEAILTANARLTKCLPNHTFMVVRRIGVARSLGAWKGTQFVSDMMIDSVRCPSFNAWIGRSGSFRKLYWMSCTKKKS